jgi:hypothetical protein
MKLKLNQVGGISGDIFHYRKSSLIKFPCNFKLKKNIWPTFLNEIKRALTLTNFCVGKDKLEKSRVQCCILSWAVSLEISARRRERDEPDVTNDDVFRSVCSAHLIPIFVVCTDMTQSP